jgi:hypothetical protein
MPYVNVGQENSTPIELYYEIRGVASPNPAHRIRYGHA